MVTGATGLVGSHLLMELLDSGQRVRALYRKGSDREKVRQLFEWYNPGQASGWDRIDWACADILDLPALEEAISGCTEVYHCAARISFDPAQRNLLLRTNVQGTRNVVNSCLALGVKRLCHVSSVAAIGGRGAIITEEEPWDSARSNGYAVSKYLAEMEAWRAGQEGLPTVIVNPGVILGPGFYSEGSGRLFGAVASGLRFSPPGGTGFVGVTDVVRAMTGLTRAGRFGDRYILVAENAAYRDILVRIAGVLGKSAPERVVPLWLLRVMRPLDWLASILSGRRRRITGAQIKALRRTRTYSNEKILHTLPDFKFTDIQTVIDSCGKHYRETGAAP